MPNSQTDEVDQAIQLSLGNTSESWKVALITAASDARTQGQAAARRDRLIVTVATLTLLVAVATLIVTLAK